MQLRRIHPTNRNSPRDCSMPCLLRRDPSPLRSTPRSRLSLRSPPRRTPLILKSIHTPPNRPRPRHPLPIRRPHHPSRLTIRRVLPHRPGRPSSFWSSIHKLGTRNILIPLLKLLFLPSLRFPSLSPLRLPPGLHHCLNPLQLPLSFPLNLLRHPLGRPSSPLFFWP